MNVTGFTISRFRYDYRNDKGTGSEYDGVCKTQTHFAAQHAVIKQASLLEVSMSVYRVIVLLHILSALGFIMAHGVSAMMIFKVSRERKYENLCNYLEISGMSMRPAMLALHGVEITGIVLTIMGKWWMMGWIWVSLALFALVGFVMGKYGAAYMGRVRRAMGMLSQKELRKGVRPNPAPYEKLLEIVESGRPRLVASAGLGGLAMIVALMTLKPF